MWWVEWFVYIVTFGIRYGERPTGLAAGIAPSRGSRVCVAGVTPANLQVAAGAGSVNMAQRVGARQTDGPVLAFSRAAKARRTRHGGSVAQRVGIRT